MEEQEKMISFPCPKCGTVYELPAECNGQEGKCHACGNIFVIQAETVMPTAFPEPQQTEVLQEEQKPDQEDTQALNVDDNEYSRMPRATMTGGMVPRVEGDKFQVQSIEKTQEQLRQLNTSATTTGFKRRTFSSGGKSMPPPVQKPWWSFLCFWKKQ